MIRKLYLNTLFLFFLFIVCSLQAISSSEESYDKVLARLDRAQEVKDQSKKDKACVISNKNWELKFEHDKLPNLNGIWKVTKKTSKRIANPVLSKPVTFVHCTSRLPFEKRDFEEKQVVISLVSPNSFSVMALYPVTDDVYHDPNQDKDFMYENFGFKAVIRPEDITYAYTIKLMDHIENHTLTRQLWLNGKLQLEHISRSKITGKGYEIEYAPECHGFVTDEVEFEFEKERNIRGAGEGIVAMSFLIEQAALASPGEGAEPNEIPYEHKSMNLESAKEKEPIELIKDYPDRGNLVPGLW